MLNWIKNIFGSRDGKGKIQMSDQFLEAGGDYIQLVKSRIIEALVTDDAKLLPNNASADQRFSLLLALCAYFAARTDYELETRGVAETIRDEVWPHVFESVFIEMGVSNQVASVARPLILGQMGLTKGMIEKKGVGDSEAVTQTLTILSGSAAAIASREKEAPLEVNLKRVADLLEQYSHYKSYLDILALQAKANIKRGA